MNFFQSKKKLINKASNIKNTKLINILYHEQYDIYKEQTLK